MDLFDLLQQNDMLQLHIVGNKFLSSNNVLTESQLLGTMAVTMKKALQQDFIPSVRARCGR